MFGYDMKNSSQIEALRRESMRLNSKRLYDEITEAEEMKYIKLKMTIEDNGVGISNANLKKLFTNYTSLDEHKKMNAKGTGLGLSICKNIVEQMGGSVSVQSTLGKGT